MSSEKELNENALVPSENRGLAKRSAGLVRRGLNSLLAREVRSNFIEMEFVKILDGQFIMGSNNGKESEKPVHEVIIRTPFFLGKYPVTQSQWQHVMGGNPSHIVGDNNPVQCVSWYDAHDFIKKLNELDGKFSYRLPTEAEWEYAGRAGTTSDYYADNLNDIAWYHANSGGLLHQVGQKLPNAFGLFDMHGSVSEWCQDRYHLNYKNAPKDERPWLTGGEIAWEKNRVARGGSYQSTASFCRSASRNMIAPFSHGLICGMRVVME